MRVRLPSSARQAKEGRCQRSCWRQQKVTCGATAAVTQPLQSAVGARRRALVMRIQRALPAGERLRKSREGSRWQAELGDYFIVRSTLSPHGTSSSTSSLVSWAAWPPSSGWRIETFGHDAGGRPRKGVRRLSTLALLAKRSRQSSYRRLRHHSHGATRRIRSKALRQ
jgi:hypothetical protein